MITVNVQTGELVGVAESNAPVPHSLTRTVTKSGNYGLADEAREAFRSEAAAFQGRGRGRIRRMIEEAINTMDDEDGNSCSGVDAVETVESQSEAGSLSTIGDGEISLADYVAERRAKEDGAGYEESFQGLSTAFERVVKVTKGKKEGGYSTNFITKCPGADAPAVCNTSKVEDDSASETSYGNNSLARGVWKIPNEERYLPRSADKDGPVSIVPKNVMYPSVNFQREIKAPNVNRTPKDKESAGKPKTNGYLLFLMDMKKKMNIQGTVNDLIKRFDKDWKALPEQEKAEWKEKAKASRSSDNGRSASGEMRPKYRQGRAGGGCGGCIKLEPHERADANSSYGARNAIQEEDDWGDY